MSDRDSGNSFLWFLAGLGIGAAVGVLYAPRSGTETREALRARADEGREYMRDRAKQAREQATEWVRPWTRSGQPAERPVPLGL